MAKWDEFLYKLKSRPTEVLDSDSSGREGGILDKLSSYFWSFLDSGSRWLDAEMPLLRDTALKAAFEEAIPTLKSLKYTHSSLKRGVAEFWCRPEANTDAELLEKVTEAGAEIMDRLLRTRSIEHVYINVVSDIPDDHTGKRVRKAVILELGTLEFHVAVTEDGLQEMVLSDPQRFRELCKLRWVPPNHIPKEPPKPSVG